MGKATNDKLRNDKRTLSIFFTLRSVFRITAVVIYAHQNNQAMLIWAMMRFRKIVRIFTLLQPCSNGY